MVQPPCISTLPNTRNLTQTLLPGTCGRAFLSWGGVRGPHNSDCVERPDQRSHTPGAVVPESEQSTKQTFRRLFSHTGWPRFLPEVPGA